MMCMLKTKLLNSSTIWSIGGYSILLIGTIIENYQKHENGVYTKTEKNTIAIWIFWWMDATAKTLTEWHLDFTTAKSEENTKIQSIYGLINKLKKKYTMSQKYLSHSIDLIFLWINLKLKPFVVTLC